MSRNPQCRAAQRITKKLTHHLQNVLYVAHEVDEAANKFGRPVEILQQLLQQCLEKLRLYREEKRPRPHLDDKILTAWNGLMVSPLFLSDLRADGKLTRSLGLRKHLNFFGVRRPYKLSLWRRSQLRSCGVTYTVKRAESLYAAGGRVRAPKARLTIMPS